MRDVALMNLRKVAFLVAILGLVGTGCDYIVPPIDFSTATPNVANEGWAGIVTNVTETGGSLHVDLSLVNKTGDWSAMDVASSKASVTDSAGKSTNCSRVFVGTAVFVNDGGWYLPPGFVMKGYTGGTVAKPAVQPIYVECDGVAKSAASKLRIDYRYIQGPFNYYTPSKYIGDSMTLDLATVVTDTRYPVASTVDKLIAKSDAVLAGINNCTVQLTDVKRTDQGIELSWQSTNPGEYPAYVHIGLPPVIGSDGILYGFYQSPHLETPPITPSGGGKADWTTKVAVPADVSGLYVLLPLETKQQKYFVDHVIDITDK
jgi:hypothetical protein